MNLRSDVNLKKLKINWRKHIYIIAGIVITGFLAFAVFRSFAFLASQLAVVFRFDASQISRSWFDVDNFEKIKGRLER